MSDTENVWELSKENVLPLKQGRKVKEIKAALGPSKDKEHAKRNKIRLEYEARLRDDLGEDPLKVYHEYISWVEQAYPEGGEEANLRKLLENTIKVFFDDEEVRPKYKNDTRFLDIFLKYAGITDDQLMIFTFMFDNGLFSRIAKFYIRWSECFEAHQNFKEADAKLQKGLDMRAFPKKELEAAQRALQARIAKLVASGQLNHDDEDAEEGRQVLGGLKGKAKKSGKVEAPVNRVGAAKKTIKGGLKSTAPVNNGKKSAPAIHVDENNDSLFALKNSICEPTAFDRTDDGAAAKFIPAQKRKENEVETKKWAGEKMKQSVPVKPAKPTFDIHADDDSDVETFARPSEANALRIRKKSPDSPPLARFEKLDPRKQRFYFDEKKIYAGGTEFSFEEIRGRKWMAARRRKEEAEQRKKLEDEVSSLKEQVALLVALHKTGAQIPSNVLAAVEPTIASPEQPPPSPVVENLEEDVPDGAADETKDNQQMDGSHKSSGQASKEALSMVRDLWNGTFAPTEPIPQQVMEKMDVPAKRALGFEIFTEETAPVQAPAENVQEAEPEAPKDENQMDEDAECSGSWPQGITCDFSLHPIGGLRGQQDLGQMTFMLPNSETEFITKSMFASTPAAPTASKHVGRTKKPVAAAPQTPAPVEQAEYAKLDTIVETSREYKSSSSSSSSSAAQTTHGTSTYNQTQMVKRFRLISGGKHEPINPFDANVITTLLDELDEPLEKRKGRFFVVNKALPKLKSHHSQLKLGQDKYLVGELRDEGAYAKVYDAQIDDAGEDLTGTMTAALGKVGMAKRFALKVCKPPNVWEFYICDELIKRIKWEKPKVDIELSVMNANPAVLYKDGTILVDEFCSNGTLVKVLNALKGKNGKAFPKTIVGYFALELLLIVKQMHTFQIIHADIKPDNVLILNFPSLEDIQHVAMRTSCLKLIDFGRSIDMRLFPAKTSFVHKVETKGSQCPEMLDGKPWSYHTDWFGVLDCLHTMIFGEYIELDETHRKLTRTFNKRSHPQKEIWEKLFEGLLNIEEGSDGACPPIVDSAIEELSAWAGVDVNEKTIIKEGNELETVVEAANRK